MTRFAEGSLNLDHTSFTWHGLIHLGSAPGLKSVSS